MLSLDKILASSFIATGITLAGVGATLAQSAAPGTPSTQQMIEQLKPHTRGLIIGGGSAPPPAAAGTSSSATLAPVQVPSAPAPVVSAPIASTPRAPAPTASAAPRPAYQAPVQTAPATATGHPSLNLRVLFAFNSADLTPEARSTLDNLGRALQSNDLKTSRFEVAGHTDAVGNDEMNKKLSEDRAAAVKNYLVTTYGIDPTRIQSVGFGKAELLDPSHPMSPVNRRVQVTNLTAAG